MAVGLCSGSGFAPGEHLFDLRDRHASQDADQQLPPQSSFHTRSTQTRVQILRLAAQEDGVCSLHCTNIVAPDNFDWKCMFGGGQLPP